MEKQQVCRFCKQVGANLMVNTTIHYKDKKYTYYSCQECNTKKLRKYRKTRSGAENTRIAVAKSIKKHPEKQIVRIKVATALRAGLLTKPNLCEDCGCATALEGHHEDYTKPLCVDWLCRSCHSKRHKKMV